MYNLAQHIYLLFLPMILANSLHMVMVKLNLFNGLNIPISQDLFGNNKTMRGFLILPILAGFVGMTGSLIAGPFQTSLFQDVLISFGMGFVYLLAELPNSYVKRRLGIENGGFSKNYRVVQVIIDRADSLIGIFLFYYLVTDISLRDTIILFFWAMLISFSTSLLLYSLKIKKSI